MTPPKRPPRFDSSDQPAEIITQAIQELRLDVPGARDRLWNLVYPWFLRLARILLATKWQRISIEPEDLLHAAYRRVGLDDLVHDQATRDHLCHWVLNAMGWVLRDCARRMKVRQEHEAPATGSDPVANLAAPVPRGLTEDERLDLQEILDRFARCDPKSMVLLKMYILEGRSYAEIADSVGFSESKVGQMLRTAFERMRQMDRDSDEGARRPQNGALGTT